MPNRETFCHKIALLDDDGHDDADHSQSGYDRGGFGDFALRGPATAVEITLQPGQQTGLAPA
jgi:hypothetical protein